MANSNSKNTEYDIALSSAELMELEAAREMPIIFDEDCPETTPERAKRFKRVNPPEMNAG